MALGKATQLLAKFWMQVKIDCFIGDESQTFSRVFHLLRRRYYYNILIKSNIKTEFFFLKIGMPVYMYL